MFDTPLIFNARFNISRALTYILSGNGLKAVSLPGMAGTHSVFRRKRIAFDLKKLLVPSATASVIVCGAYAKKCEASI